MEILDKLMMQILDFLSLRNLLSNELFFTFYYFTTASLLLIKYYSLYRFEVLPLILHQQGYLLHTYF